MAQSCKFTFPEIKLKLLVFRFKTYHVLGPHNDRLELDYQLHFFFMFDWFSDLYSGAICIY